MKSLKITVDRELCATCDVCTQVAPATFELDGDGKAMVKDPGGDPREAIIKAGKGCPTEAIAIWDGETGQKLVPEVV